MMCAQRCVAARGMTGLSSFRLNELRRMLDFAVEIIDLKRGIYF